MKIKTNRKKLLINSGLGIGAALGLVLFTNSLFAGQTIILIFGILSSLILGYILIRRLQAKSVNFNDD